MDTKQLAMLVLILIGAVTALAAVWVTVRRPFDPKHPEPRWKSFFLGGLAVLMIGLGGFGVRFLDPYGKFLGQIAGLSPGEEQAFYTEVTEKISTGEMPEELLPVVRAYMLQNPVENLDAILAQGALQAHGTDKQFLEGTRVELQRKLDTTKLATQALAQEPGGAARAGERLMRLDETSLRLLRQKPDDELTTLSVDPAVLRELAGRRIRRVDIQ